MSRQRKRRNLIRGVFLCLFCLFFVFGGKNIYLQQKMNQLYLRNTISYENGLTGWYTFGNETTIKKDKTILFHKDNSDAFASGKEFSVVWRGMLKVDKSQFYLFTTGSDDDSALFIDGVRVIDNLGEHAFLEKDAKVFLLKGEHAIDVTYRNRKDAAYIELRWDTYDKDPHIVPAQNLVPLNFSFDVSARNSLADQIAVIRLLLKGIIAMALIFVVYLVLCFVDCKFFRLKEGKEVPSFFNRYVGKKSFFYDRLAIFFVLLVLFIAIFTVGHYGITMDEPLQSKYGKLVLRFYESGFLDHSFMQHSNLSYYGAFFDLVTAFVKKFSSLDNYHTGHMMNVLVGILGIVGCFRVGRFLGGSKAGFWSAFLLTMIPVYYGHMFNNPKDIPFATGYIWSIYYLLRAMSAFPKCSDRVAWKLGMAIGLTLGVRVGGFLFFAYLLGATLLYLSYVMVKVKGFGTKLKIALGFIRPTVITLFTSYTVMLLCWPRAFLKPFSFPFYALQVFSKFPYRGKVLFHGNYMNAKLLPWDYLPQIILYKLPEVILGLLFLGVVFALMWFFKKYRTEKTPNMPLYLMLLVTIFFPLSYAIARGSIFYDGMRHVLFILPPIACVSGIVLVYVVDYLRKRLPILRVCVILGLVVYFYLHIGTMITLHPNQYVYYNQLIGGLNGAEGEFATDYYGNSYKLATEALVNYVEKENEGKMPPYPVYVVTSAGDATAVSHYLPPANFIHRVRESNADFFISFTRWGVDKALDGEEIFQLAPYGVKLVVVKDRRKLKAKEEQK